MLKFSLPAFAAFLVCAFGLTVVQAEELTPASPAVAATATSADAELQTLIDKIRPSYVFVSGGSGVCVTPDGYVLTNHHVVPTGAQMWDRSGKPQKLRVRMPGRKGALSAQPVAADPRGDIVVLKIDLPEGETLPYAPLADSDLVKVGDVVVAIGNPFLLGSESNDPSVSLGVVSATGRHQSGYSDAFQVDAAVNPGNSGGPSYNLKGEVIGINGRILTAHARRYNTGAGYTIPAAQIKRFWKTMTEKPGGSTVARHGVIAGLALDHRRATPNVSDEDSPLSGLPVELIEEHIFPRVADVREGSDAWRAGLRKDDEITHIESYPVHSTSQFYGKLQTWPLNAEVELTVRRDEKDIKVRVPLNVPVNLNQSSAWPFPEDSDESKFIFALLHDRSQGQMFFNVGSPMVKLGINVKQTDTDNPEKAGIFIESVAAGSTVDGILKEGEVLQKVGERRIRYLTDLQDCLMGYKNGDTIDLTLRNKAGDIRSVKVTFTK